MGTTKESFVELTERIGRKTGGLSVSPMVSDVRGRSEPVALLMVSGKTMGEKAGDLLSLFQDVLLTARLDDRERFRQVLDIESTLGQQRLVRNCCQHKQCCCSRAGIRQFELQLGWM